MKPENTQEQISFEKSEDQKKLEELPQENKNEILSNQAFKRFAGGFELYQELINREHPPADRNLIISRMHELYKPRQDKEDGHFDETQKNLRAALVELILSAQLCENAKKENLK